MAVCYTAGELFPFLYQTEKAFLLREGYALEKKTMATELAYVFGIVFVALGVALMEKADFGVSMVVAPAYLVYRALSPALPFFSFGMAEYCLQALLLIVMALVLRRFRGAWLFSFVTAVVYGFVLDGFMWLAGLFAADTLWMRGLCYVLGMIFCSAGVSAMFHTYIAPEVYELFVKEVSAQFRVPISRFKTAYDCVSCAVGVGLSFAFFGLGQFVGVKWGTILCALINGWIIGRFSAFYEKHWRFEDKMSWRPFFTGEKSLSPEAR